MAVIFSGQVWTDLEIEGEQIEQKYSKLFVEKYLLSVLSISLTGQGLTACNNQYLPSVVSDLIDIASRGGRESRSLLKQRVGKGLTYMFCSPDLQTR